MYPMGYIAIHIQIDQIPNDPNLTRVFRIAVRNSNVVCLVYALNYTGHY
jgi:hypothetical protein